MTKEVKTILIVLIQQMTDEYSVIGRSLFKKETNLQTFTGLKVQLSTGEEGVIEGGFGQSGKFKVRIPSKNPIFVTYNFRFNNCHILDLITY